MILFLFKIDGKYLFDFLFFDVNYIYYAHNTNISGFFIVFVSLVWFMKLIFLAFEKKIKKFIFLFFFGQKNVISFVDIPWAVFWSFAGVCTGLFVWQHWTRYGLLWVAEYSPTAHENELPPFVSYEYEKDYIDKLMANMPKVHLQEQEILTVTETTKEVDYYNQFFYDYEFTYETTVDTKPQNVDYYMPIITDSRLPYDDDIILYQIPKKQFVEKLPEEEYFYTREEFLTKEEYLSRIATSWFVDEFLVWIGFFIGGFIFSWFIYSYFKDDVIQKKSVISSYDDKKRAKIEKQKMEELIKQEKTDQLIWERNVRLGKRLLDAQQEQIDYFNNSEVKLYEDKYFTIISSWSQLETFSTLYENFFNLIFSGSPLETFLVFYENFNNKLFDTLTINIFFNFFLIFLIFYIFISLTRPIYLYSNIIYFFNSALESIFYTFKNLVKNLRFERFFFFLIILFVFIIFTNFGGFSLYELSFTSHAIVALFLSFIVFFNFFINILINFNEKIYEKFLQKNLGVVLQFILFIIELVSFFVRPFSLGVRLFANILSGHILIHIFFNAFIYIYKIIFWLSLLLLLFCFFILFLEIFVACVQAYIFLILSCIYLQDVGKIHT